MARSLMLIIASSLLAAGAVAAAPLAQGLGRRDAPLLSEVDLRLGRVKKDCVLSIPANALSASGLSTPWQVSGCDQRKISTFADCTILDTVTGALAVYYPLIVNVDDAVNDDYLPPTPVTLPHNSAVVCHLGTNGESLTLDEDVDGALVGADCVNGLGGGDIFGQFAACGARAFWSAVVALGPRIVVPPLGVAKSGRTCYTTRSFEVVDMDPSDNCVASYLLSSSGVLAQNTAANMMTLQRQQNSSSASGAPTVLHNGSDNLLLVRSLDAALGCTPFLAPDLTQFHPAAANGHPPPAMQMRGGSAALNEIQAAARQQDPVALVPSLDPMALINDNRPNINKQNLYRRLVFQPAVRTNADARDQLGDFCTHHHAAARSVVLDSPYTVGQPSPDFSAAKDLYTFMGQRHQETFEALGCGQILRQQQGNASTTIVAAPITVGARRGRQAIALTFNVASLPELATLLSACGIDAASANAMTASTTPRELTAPPKCVARQ